MKQTNVTQRCICHNELKSQQQEKCGKGQRGLLQMQQVCP